MVGNGIWARLFSYCRRPPRLRRFFGLTLSNDEWPFHPEKPGVFPPLPLIDGEKIVKPGLMPDDMNHITRWYTDRAVKFIGSPRSDAALLRFS